jgi:acetyl/propionyl-CoA carboxylase alpha subunit
MQSEFQRVAIVNRGEPAMRFIHAVREFNHERGTSLRTIALFTDPDRDAMFVREADEAVSLGPAHFTDPSTSQSKCSYVDYGRLERALTAAGAEAAWVGWGFVAEHAEFADLCRDLGIVFIGPDGAVMRRLGDKITAKRLAEEAGIPVAPWSGGPVETLADARHHAERLGYPLLIKATAGGGGHGIRRAHSSSELANAFERARAEACKAFGNPTVFLEQLVESARHVEVQIIADGFGTTWAAGVRDCTIQRRHQKVLEEAPSPAISPAQGEALREAAVRLSRAAGYSNAGTVEFLYQPEHQRFSFMEMNTRLQVEHPVTECTTGIDLVKLQIHIARGGRLEGAPPHTTGHAIEVRLNAEDPDNGFAPAPGVIKRFRIPTGPGVRIDTGVAEGDVVPPDFDSMIAKVIAYGQTRNEALSRLQRALRDSVVVIQGGASNKTFLLELIGRPEVQNGAVDVGWLDRLAASGNHVSRRYADVALVQAALEAYAAEAAVEQTQFYASAARGRPRVRGEAVCAVELRHRGIPYALKVCQLGARQYRVEADGSRIEVRLDRLGPFEYRLTGFGRSFHVVSVVQGLTYRIDVDGVSHRIERDDGGVVHAPAPAIVVSIAVAPGDIVSAGDPLVVLEAMKMEMQVVAPFAGKVRSVAAMPYVQVDTGAPLVQIEPAEAAEADATSERVVFGAPRAVDANEATGASRSRRILDELRQLMLGFDFETGYAARLLAEWRQLGATPTDDGETRQLEDEILNIFTDICSLFHRQPAVDGPIGGTAPSAESHLFTD